jgi:hypothetical protein
MEDDLWSDEREKRLNESREENLEEVNWKWSDESNKVKQK